VIESQHAGYENNDGGFGSLEFDVEKKTVSWTHNDNIVTQETSEYEI
jgi:hypothetical protein